MCPPPVEECSGEAAEALTLDELLCHNEEEESLGFGLSKLFSKSSLLDNQEEAEGMETGQEEGSAPASKNPERDG